MKRSRFLEISAVGMLGLAINPIWGANNHRDNLLINGARLNNHLQELSKFGRNSNGGVTRVAYSKEDRMARNYVLQIMNDAGLDTHIDNVGNIIGKYAGKKPILPPLMSGSHIDSVPLGGNYDGDVGVMAAIEVAQTINENKIRLRHPFEVVIFANEEGGKTGSRGMIGDLTRKDLHLKTHSGKTNAEGINFIGGDVSRLEDVIRKKGDIAGFIELHIEQGAILYKDNIDIGVVEGIVGIKRWKVTINGFANHAGTTPMKDRRNALLSAARFIKQVNGIITKEEGRQVGTIGQVEVSPGAPNVVPGKVVLSLEIRDLNMEKIDFLFQEVVEAAKTIKEIDKTSFDFDHVYTTQSVMTNQTIQNIIVDSIQNLGYESVRIPSGAGHDAQSIAQIAPMGMIFVPSIGGISHSPEEITLSSDIVKGANVLLHTLIEMDESMY